jgi:hypothetical protein
MALSRHQNAGQNHDIKIGKRYVLLTELSLEKETLSSAGDNKSSPTKSLRIRRQSIAGR